MGKIIVIGAGGQLGQCLKAVAEINGISEISYAKQNEANILDQQQLNQFLGVQKPTYVINCAAYTAVDLAEDETDKADAINQKGAANLAEACKAHKATLIHVSTDFVFEGNKVKLLNETDATCPVNIYGRTKLDGENAIASTLKEHYILRTSWLYSEFGNNFVKTILKLAVQRDVLNIISDQVGSPTYGIDLASAIFTIITNDKKQYGIYHYSNEGVTSWFDFATAIFSLSEKNLKVNPIPGSAYQTKAKRPGFSVMDKTKIKETFNLEIPYWRNSLEVCIKNLTSNH